MSSGISSADRSAGLTRLIGRLWWRAVGGGIWLALVAAVLGVGTWAAVDHLGATALVALRRATAGGALPAVVVRAEHGIAGEQRRALVRSPVRIDLARCVGPAVLARGAHTAEVLVLGLELAKEAMARPQRFTTARMPPAEGHAKLLLDAATAAQLGVVPGDDLVLTGEGTVRCTLVALLDPPGAQRTAGSIAVVELEAAQTVFARSDVDQLELLLEPTADPGREARRLARDLGAGFVARPVDRSAGSRTGEALRTTWQMGGWIALAFACVAVVAAVRELVRATARSRRLLRALGAAPHVLGLIAVLPAAACTTVATALGLALGGLLLPGLRTGCEAWVAVQTGVQVHLEDPVWRWSSRLAIVGMAALLGAAGGLAFAGERHRAVGSAAAIGGRRLVLAVVAFALVILLAHTGAVSASRWLRVIDLFAGIAAVALAAPPVMAWAARCLRRVRRRAIGGLLAAARIGHRPGSLVGVVRVLAVATAISVALGSVEHSLRAARPELVRQRVPGDVLVTTATAWLGLPFDRAALAAALRAHPAARNVHETGRDDVLGVDLRTGRALRERLPTGALAFAAEPVRKRLLAASALALDTIAAIVRLLAATAAGAVVLLWWLGAERERHTERLLVAFGATGGQLLAVRLHVAVAVGCAAALVGVLGGTLLGHAWTRGPLRSVLGFDCAFAPPFALLVLAPLLALATMLAAALLAGQSRIRPS